MKVRLLADDTELRLMHNYVPRVGDNLIVNGNALRVQYITYNDDTNELTCECVVEFVLSKDQINTVRKYVVEDNKIAAVRFLRTITKCSSDKLVSFINSF